MFRRFDHAQRRLVGFFFSVQLLASSCGSGTEPRPASPSANTQGGSGQEPIGGQGGLPPGSMMPPGMQTPIIGEMEQPNPSMTPAQPVNTGGATAPMIDEGDMPSLSDNECEATDAYEPLVAREGETCYEFRTHGQSSPTDTSKFDVAPGESYNQFYFDVPWPAGQVATRFGAKFDNLQVLHHWLGFASDAPVAAGTVQRDVAGTTLGENAELMGGWAVGGCNVEFPADVGLRLRSTGKIMLQWHHYNSTSSMQQDGTIIQFCTVPEGQRTNIGSVTWLGSENILVPPGEQSETFGTCINDSDGPITIIAFWPHMHETGNHMRSEVMRVGETEWTEVFSKPFTFDYQVHYKQQPYLVLQPGDQIRSTCTFMNKSALPVGFGQSTKAEMCYQFAYSYPEGALNNGVISLIGATNTCWQFGE